jgi:hypothetical protein
LYSITVDEQRAGLRRPVTVDEMDVEQLLDEGLHLGGHRRRTRHRHHVSAAEQVLSNIGEHISLVRCAAVQFGLNLGEDHVPDTWHEAQLRRPDERKVFQERR